MDSVRLVLPLAFSTMLVHRDCFDSFSAAAKFQRDHQPLYSGFEIWPTEKVDAWRGHKIQTPLGDVKNGPQKRS